MRSGTKPTVLDRRDFSYHRTFGAISSPLPTDYNVDIGKTMPNQDADGLPYGCTGYTQADNRGDDDDAIYKPPYTYEKTCYMEGHDTNQGCDIRTSLQSTQIYGVQRIDEDSDSEAEQHRGGQYFNVYDDGSTDWFDSIRNAIFNHQHGVSCGTPWFPTFERVDSRGVLLMPPVLELQQLNNWHNWACKGWKTIDGVPYLLVKSWQGENYGDKGWVYMSREIANAIFEIRGSVIFIQAHAVPSDIQTIRIGLWQYVLVYLYRLLGKLRLN